MKTSEFTDQIAMELVNLQIAIKDVNRSQQGYQYKYADLESILLLVRPLLHQHNLAITQFPCNEENRVGVTTRLMHVSGQWMENTLTMDLGAPKSMTLPQAAGSVITYCRRYSVAAILGITQTDDDAALADAQTRDQYKAKKAKSDELY